MKNTLYFLALSVSLILTSCTSNEQDSMPLSPQFEKKEVNDINLPYNYLQSFDEVSNVKVDYQMEKDGLILLVNTGSQKIKHMYAVIEQHGVPVMVFLGSSDDKKYFVKGINVSRSISIRIYGGFKDDTQLVNTIPYSPSTVFNNIAVQGWASSDSYIKVSSTKFPAGLIHLYTELKTKKGNVLVFLGRPAEEDFEIPKYGDLGIADLKLFGNTAYKFTKAN
ncbi:MAG: hypothetical protein EHM47_15485 [Ignavibacteriales bacterium]|nr:MAG: hypothetical protein EHM47_15485 [Ignavibacteriales bacterium]